MGGRQGQGLARSVEWCSHKEAESNEEDDHAYGRRAGGDTTTLSGGIVYEQ